MVLILVASASVLGFSYVTRSTIKLSSSSNLVQASEARYMAESGLFHGMYALRVTPEAMAGSDVTPLGPYTLDGSGCSYTFGSAPVAGQTGQYWLASDGTAEGITQRVSLKVRFDNHYYDLMMSMNPHDYWRLGETWGTNANAVRGSDGVYCNGVILGGPGGILHDADKSAQFDGVNDYVDLEDLEIHEEQMSLMAWVYPLSGIGKYARIISKAESVSMQDRFWQLQVTSVGGQRRLRFCLKTQTGNVTRYVTASSGHVELNKWTFVVGTYDGAMMRLYKDGVEVGSLAHFGKVAKDDDIDAWIGGNPGSGARFWKGRIDEVAIFHRALTAAEIMALYKARTPDVRLLSWDKNN